MYTISPPELSVLPGSERWRVLLGFFAPVNAELIVPSTSRQCCSYQRCSRLCHEAVGNVIWGVPGFESLTGHHSDPFSLDEENIKNDESDPLKVESEGG